MDTQTIQKLLDEQSDAIFKKAVSDWEAETYKRFGELLPQYSSAFQTGQDSSKWAMRLIEELKKSLIANVMPIARQQHSQKFISKIQSALEFINNQPESE